MMFIFAMLKTMTMKRKLTTIAVMLTAMTTAQAGDYAYIVFATADGTATYMTAEGTHITYGDGQMTAANDGDSATISLSELSYMAFTNTVNGSTTAISSLSASATAIIAGDGCVTVSGERNVSAHVSDLSGTTVAAGNTGSSGTCTLGKSLPRGIYIVTIGDKSAKIILR